MEAVVSEPVWAGDSFFFSQMHAIINTHCEDNRHQTPTTDSCGPTVVKAARFRVKNGISRRAGTGMVNPCIQILMDLASHGTKRLLLHGPLVAQRTFFSYVARRGMTSCE